VLLVRRIAVTLVAWVVLSLGVFALFDLTPGRAGDELALEAGASIVATGIGPEMPWRQRYWAWIRGALRGNLGQSRSFGRPVGTLIVERALFTARVAWPAVTLMWLLAVPLGLYAGLQPRGRLDTVVLASTSALGAVPEIVLAFALLWLAVSLGVFTTLGSATSASESSTAAALWQARALPIALMVLVQLPTLVRHVRVTVRNLADQPFARAARARGLSEHQFVRRHVVRLSAPALAALAAQSIAGAMGGALVAETVFSWPGLGALLYSAALARDEALVVAAVLVTAAIVMMANLAADAMAAALDPRPVASFAGD
jgi:peptide/nickel transport system permease protein